MSSHWVDENWNKYDSTYLLALITICHIVAQKRVHIENFPSALVTNSFRPFAYHVRHIIHPTRKEEVVNFNFVFRHTYQPFCVCGTCLQRNRFNKPWDWTLSQLFDISSVIKSTTYSLTRHFCPQRKPTFHLWLVAFNKVRIFRIGASFSSPFDIPALREREQQVKRKRQAILNVELKFVLWAN